MQNGKCDFIEVFAIALKNPVKQKVVGVSPSAPGILKNLNKNGEFRTLGTTKVQTLSFGARARTILTKVNAA